MLLLTLIKCNIKVLWQLSVLMMSWVLTQGSPLSSGCLHNNVIIVKAEFSYNNQTFEIFLTMLCYIKCADPNQIQIKF